MANTSHLRAINPRLGTYFGIFASAFVAIVLTTLILEQLSVSENVLRWVMVAGPVLLYALIGLSSYCASPADFFTAGRRVPPVFNGVVLAILTVGGTGIVAVTGAIFLIGYDALCIVIAWSAGLVVMAVLIVPCVRKLGAYTIPGFLGLRFDSRLLRVASAVMLVLPALFILVAEIKIGALVAGWMLGVPISTLIPVGASIIAATVILGGMRSATWSGTAKAIGVLLALAVPVTIVAVMMTNMPVPQFSHGPVLKALGKLEKAQGLLIAFVPPFTFDLPGQGFEPILKRLAAPFGSIGRGSFIIASFVFMAGIASLPGLLARTNTSRGVYEARKSLGWAVVIVGVIALTLSAIAVFLRYTLMDEIIGIPADRLPAWFATLVQAGFASYDNQVARLALEGVSFKRDAVLLALPIAVGLPAVFVLLALAGALTAALASAAGRLVALAAMLSEDIVLAGRPERVADPVRVALARVTVAVAAIVGAWTASSMPSDPLRLVLWALALAGSSAFPVLVLAIWWKRINAWGALGGMLVGFCIALFCILAGQVPLFGLDPALAGVVAIPLAFAAAFAISLATPAPRRAALELVRDMRNPGGEAVHDRQARMLRVKKHQANRSAGEDRVVSQPTGRSSSQPTTS